MNVAHASSIDNSSIGEVIEESFAVVDDKTILLLYFSLEEIVLLTPGEQHLLATIMLEQENTQDNKHSKVAKEYQERIRRIVTKSDSIPNRIK